MSVALAGSPQSALPTSVAYITELIVAPVIVLRREVSLAPRSASAFLLLDAAYQAVAAPAATATAAAFASIINKAGWNTAAQPQLREYLGELHQQLSTL